MPHADHFLSRLDRLNTSEVDTALQLYRDPDLLRAIMLAAKVPDSVPRVAISLADPKEGPFIVVTRDGYFVTCLGRGMQAKNLPIVTRGQLDALAEKVETLRERLALAKKMAGERDRPFLHLMRRLMEHADCLSREEFLAVSVWDPMLPNLFLDLYLENYREITQLTLELCSVKRFPGKQGEFVLSSYWRLAHVTGHMALMGTQSGESDHFLSIANGFPALRGKFAWPLTQMSLLPFITQGSWAVGRFGKGLLPFYKKALGECASFNELLDTIFGLIAIGRRNSSLRAEIVKALHTAPTTARHPDAETLRQRQREDVAHVCGLASKMIECSNDELETSLLRLGRSVVGARGRKLSEERLREVMGIAPTHAYWDGLSNRDRIATTALIIAATARNPPENFYYPEALLREFRVKWEPKLSLALLRTRQPKQPAPVPAHRQGVPGRNDPCSCGSGMKYKKCCGAD